MKIWFDVLTPKQVNFFKLVVGELKNREHDILCTSRKYREVEELAKIRGLELKIVGEHGGESLNGKLKASAERVLELADVIREFNPDALVSSSSPEASRVAFGLAIPHLGFNDSPHAEAVCRLCLPFMNKLMCPWVIPFKEFTRYGIAKNQILRYRALDPAMWIKDGKCIYRHQDLKLDPAKKTITFRLEESKAAYRSGIKSNSSSLLNALITYFRDCNIVVLCRYLDQLESVSRDFGNSAIVIDRVIDGMSLLMLSDVFIGSGGTMNCEASLLGVPNMSYAMHNVYLNRFLFSKGISYKCRSANEMAKLARKMLSDERIQKMIKSKSQMLLSQMEDPKKKIIRVLESKK